MPVTVIVNICELAGMAVCDPGLCDRLLPRAGFFNLDTIDI